MIQKIKTEFLVDPLNFFKEYLSVIILIPVILGGFWQIIALSSMSFSFVRFFSSSQLVADGLLILIIISASLILSIFYRKVADEYLEHKGIKETGLEFVKKHKIFYMVCFFIGAIIIFLVFENTFILDKKSYPSVNPFLLNLLKYIIIFLTINFGLSVGWKVAFQDNNNLAKCIFIFGLLLHFINFSIIAKEFHNKFFLPNNLSNIKPIEKKLINDYKVKKVELLYFNDKYLFYSIGNTGKIKIIDFNKLTDSY